SAKDLRTSAISSNKTVTLSAGSPTYVTFTTADFPVTTPVVANFVFTPATPGINQDITFTASGSTPSGATYNWNFGDGSTPGTGQTITHRYAREGTYNVTLTVGTDGGPSATATRSVIVTSTLPANSVNFTFSPTNPGVNQD